MLQNKKILKIQTRSIDEICENFLVSVSVKHCRVEDLALAADEKVDVIVSEWMGYFLLYESMLESVLFARDRFLKPNGTIFPRFYELCLCAISDLELHSSHVAFWDNVYGYKVSARFPLSPRPPPVCSKLGNPLAMYG